MNKVLFLIPEATVDISIFSWLSKQTFAFLWYVNLKYDDIVPNVLTEDEFSQSHSVLFTRCPYDRTYNYWNSLRNNEEVSAIARDARHYGFLRFLEKVDIIEHVPPMSDYWNKYIDQTIAVENFARDCQLIPEEVYPIQDTSTDLKIENWRYIYENPLYNGYDIINTIYKEDFELFDYEMVTEDKRMV